MFVMVTKVRMCQNPTASTDGSGDKICDLPRGNIRGFSGVGIQGGVSIAIKEAAKKRLLRCRVVKAAPTSVSTRILM